MLDIFFTKYSIVNIQSCSFHFEKFADSKQIRKSELVQNTLGYQKLSTSLTKNFKSKWIFTYAINTKVLGEKCPEQANFVPSDL